MSDTDDDGLPYSAMYDTDDDGLPPSYSKVTNDLQKMINDPDFSNVVFICKDGTPVHGCSFLLAARNNFFRGMFLSGLAESQQSEIPLPEISATGLLAMMEMLYTGRMDKYQPKFRDCKAICETMVAAEYFLIEVYLWFDLMIATKWTKDDIQSAVKNYSIVVEYAFKYGGPFSLVSRYLAGMLVLAPLKPEHLQTLSGDAVLHLLKVTETTCVESETNPHVLARTELGRFRTMFLWCACKEFSSECVTTPLPFTAISQEIACTLKLFERSSKKPKKPKHVIREQQDMYNKINSQLAQAVQKYLPLVNYRHFAPDDLLQIVAPMKIVPDSDIKAATQFQKLRTPVTVEMQTLGWLTDSMYKVSEDGCRIQQHKSREGYAIHKLCAISKAGGFYEWEICIEEVCHSYIEVGLLYSKDVHDLSRFEHDCFSHPRHEFALRERSTLRKSGVPLSTEVFSDAFAFRMDNTGMSIHSTAIVVDHGKSHHGKRRYGKDCSRLVYGKHYAHKNSKVKISLDMSKAECSISVDNEHFGVAWAGLRAGVYQPAVSLGDRPSGAVRIKVLRIGQWDCTL